MIKEIDQQKLKTFGKLKDAFEKLENSCNKANESILTISQRMLLYKKFKTKRN